MQWNLIDSVTLEKPRHGMPCNGCGVCCIATVCELGVTLGDDINCKALTPMADGSFQCGMVVDPYRFMDEKDLHVWKTIDGIKGDSTGEQALKKSHFEMLGAGRGCDSDDQAVEEFLAEARAFEQIKIQFV
jgi:hypothetical protein